MCGTVVCIGEEVTDWHKRIGVAPFVRYSERLRAHCKIAACLINDCAGIRARNFSPMNMLTGKNYAQV